MRIFALASIAIVTSAPTAHALGPVDVEVGAKAGSGTPFKGFSRLGFGFGARAGVVVLEHLYAGVDLAYYLGSSTSGLALSPGNQSSGQTYSVAVHTLMYGAEVGWGFELNDIVTLRPQLGVGIATFPVSTSSGSGSQFSGAASSFAPDVETPPDNLYLEPGFTGLVALGVWFVGADANILVFPGQQAETSGGGVPAFTLHVQGGVKF
jgi:hypothetical protein